MKGKKSKTIQVHEVAEAIIKGYGYQFPKCSQQDENVIIKEVSEKAGITEVYEKIRHSGSKLVASIVPKYKMVSSHTARRSFARRWYERGGDMLKLSKFLGHSSIRTTELYVGVEDNEANDEMMRVI